MKIAGRIVLVLVILLAIPLVIALFVKKDFHIEREITINKPKEEVFAYIRLLKNQSNFSKWAKMDPNMKTAYRGTDGAVGFVSAWQSDDKNVGQGEQEIKGITDGARVDYQIRFIKPFAATPTAYLATEAAGSNQTKVKWGFDGSHPYPMNIINLSSKMNDIIGADLQTGLNNLKALLEKQ